VRGVSGTVRTGTPVAQEEVRKESMNMPGKRELIEPTKGDKRFVRRDEKGRFSEVVDAGRSMTQDRKRTAKTESKSGYGDRGDRKR
jgi:hypothetical protein